MFTENGNVGNAAPTRSELERLLTAHQVNILSGTIARRLAQTYGHFIPFDELKGFAQLGIAKAFVEFDPARFVGTRDFTKRFFAHMLTKGYWCAIDEMRSTQTICRFRNGRYYGRAVWAKQQLSWDVSDEGNNDPARLVGLEDLLQTTVQNLTERERAIFTLHYVEGVALIQIARQIGISTTRVYVLHNRVLEKIRAAFEKEGVPCAHALAAAA